MQLRAISYAIISNYTQKHVITYTNSQGGPSFSSLHETLGKYASETESFDDNDYVINCHITLHGTSCMYRACAAGAQVRELTSPVAPC